LGNLPRAFLTPAAGGRCKGTARIGIDARIAP
jgi:hypothetical protein